MPEVSRFYGIVVRMFYDEHAPPHFHVYYQDSTAAVRIDTLMVMRGELPRRALSLITEWALAHRQELRQNWSRAECGEALSAIPPLE